MQATRNINLGPTHYVTTIRSESILLMAIQVALTEDAGLVRDNPGLIAVVRTLAVTEENKGDVIRKALTEYKPEGFTKSRVDDAEKYINRTAMFLTPAGRAWGILLCAALANANHDAVTGIQREIFGGRDIKPIITTAALRAIFNAMATTQVTIDGTNKSLATIVIEQVGAFGSPDNNVVGALIPMAIQGKLTDALFIQVVSGLRTESANPAMAVPREVVETAVQMLSSIHPKVPTARA